MTEQQEQTTFESKPIDEKKDIGRHIAAVEMPKSDEKKEKPAESTEE